MTAENDRSGSRAIPLPKRQIAAGFVAPVIGRKARKDVEGYFGFALIRKGDVISDVTYDRAQQMGRLYELIAATEAD